MARVKWFLILSPCLIILALWKTEVRTNISDFIFSVEGDDAFLVGQLQSDELSRRYLVAIVDSDHPVRPCNNTGMDCPNAVAGDADMGSDSYAKINTRTETRSEVESLQLFINALQARLKTSTQIRRIWSGGIENGIWRRLIQFYSPHQVQLFSLTPQEAYPALLSKQGLKMQAAQIKEALLGPDPALVKSIISTDPMLLSLNWLKQLEKAFRRQSAQQGIPSLFIETNSSGMDVAIQEEIQQFLQTTFNKMNADYGGKYKMEVTGVPVFSVHIKKQVSRDIQRISTASMLTIAVLFLWVFRSWQALFTTAIILLTTISIAILVTQWLFGFVHGLTLALGITLVGVCIDYPIHSMVHAAKEKGHRRVLSIKKIWPSLLLGGVTTVIGYLALGLSGFPGLQQISTFATAGILTALLITHYLLPNMMDLFKLEMQPRINPAWILDSANSRYSRIILLVLAAAYFLVGGYQVKWQSDLNMMTPSLAELKERDLAIRSRLATVEPGRFVLIEGGDIEEALQTSEKVQPVLAKIQAQGGLDSFYPIFPWLASKRVQTLNEQRWNSSLTPELREQWRMALESEGLSSNAFPALKESHEVLLDVERLRDSPVWELLSRQLIQYRERAVVTIWLGKHSPEKVIDALQEIPKARYFSQKESTTELMETYRKKAQSMLLWGLLAILILLIGRFRSITRALWVMAPATLSIIVVIGAWGLSGSSMNMLHLIGLLLAAAICVDYGIFFAENRSGNKALTFQAITVSSLTSSLSFACLGAAENPALHALAWTVSPGVMIGYLLCPVMLRVAPRRR